MSEHGTGAGRVVVITGASSGIGRAVALSLAEDGACLVLASRSATTLEQVRADCKERGASAVLVQPTDVGDASAVDALLDAAVEELGRVDVVIHAAAVLAYGRFETVPAEVFDRVLRTNVTGTGNVARSTLRVFGEQGHGHLIVIGSVMGKITAPFMSSYAVSKWAVHGLVRTLQIEARKFPGIEVSLVAPGGVNTPIYTQAGSYTGFAGRPPQPIDDPERLAALISRTIDRPRRELSVGLANPLMVAGFRLLPAVYDVLVTPMMRLIGQSRTRTEPHPGNVFEPAPEAEEVHGDWPRRWLS